MSTSSTLATSVPASASETVATVAAPPLTVEWVIADGCWSLTAPANDQTIGWRQQRFALGDLLGEPVGAVEQRGAQRVLTLRYAGLPVVETVTFTFDAANCSLTVERLLRAEQDVTLPTPREGVLDAAGKLLVWTDNAHLRYAHSNNLRTEDFPVSRGEYPYVRQIPFEQRTLNRGDANPIPWLYITDENYTLGLVEAALADGPLRRITTLRGESNMSGRGLTTYHSELQPIAAAHLTLAAGAQVRLGVAYYQMLQQTHPQDAMAGYLRAFAERHQRCGPQSRMRTGGCFCSWNYGPDMNVNHEQLIARAKVIAQHMPQAHHFLLDSGYQRHDWISMGGFYPDPEQNVDLKKFPQGMRAYRDEVAALGLQPGIWLSPMILLDDAVMTENPDWVLPGHDGQPLRIGKSGYIDLSVPAARQWADHVLRTLFVTWGFAGCKLDFQSQMFDSDLARYRSGTGRQWREWYYGRIRQLVGPDGFFETCIAMSLGDPHLSLTCDAYRLGSDISPACWQRHVDANRWALQALAIPGRDFALMNMDSFGWDPNCTRAENIHRANWCFITQGLLEFGGELEKFPPDIIDFYARVLRHPDRGYPCQVLDEAAFTGLPFPRVLMVDYPRDSPTRQRGIRKHVALFNWSNEPALIGATWQQLGVSSTARITDFWDEHSLTPNPHGVYEMLPGHDSRLLEIHV